MTERGFREAYRGFKAADHKANQEKPVAVPFEYRIHPDKQTVTSTALGVISDVGFYLYNRTLHADERFDPAFRRVVDLTGVQPGSRGETETLQEIARNNPFAHAPAGRLRFFNELAFGLARMHGLLPGGTCSENTGVFHSREEAGAWLSESGSVAGLP